MHIGEQGGMYDLKSPMEAEDLAHPKLVSDLDFHNIIYATMIARYGKAVMDASKEMCIRDSRSSTRSRSGWRGTVRTVTCPFSSSSTTVRDF